jgi:hypothetical protein
MSEEDLETWNQNFLKVLDQLEEKSSSNHKNLALIGLIKKEVLIIIEKQKQENDLCKNQF